MPPVCDVCGWVCTPASLRAVETSPEPVQLAQTKSELRKAGDGIGVILGCIFMVGYMAFWALVILAVGIWAWKTVFG